MSALILEVVRDMEMIRFDDGKMGRTFLFFGVVTSFLSLHGFGNLQKDFMSSFHSSV